MISAAGDSNPSDVDGNQVAQLANGDYLECNGINFGTGSTRNPANPPVGSFAVANSRGPRTSRSRYAAVRAQRAVDALQRAATAGNDDEEQMAFDALLYRLLVIGEAVKALLSRGGLEPDN